MIGQKEDKDSENCPLIKYLKLPKARTPFLSPLEHLSTCTLLFLFPFLFTYCLLDEFFPDKAGKN